MANRRPSRPARQRQPGVRHEHELPCAPQACLPHDKKEPCPMMSHARRSDELVGWFLRRHAAQWSAADEQAFQQWLGTPENQAAYARWEADWRLMDAMPQPAADRLRAQVAADRSARATSHHPAAPRRRVLTGGLALAGMAAMATSGGWLAWQHVQAQPVYEQAFATRRGQQSDVTLPDGSGLRLDTGTALQATFFRGRREVRLDEGQAMFSVSADAQRPFLVVAGPVTVTVVGTRFSVRRTPHLPGREGVEIAVEEGRVRVVHAQDAAASGALAGQALELTPGQRLVFAGDGRESVLSNVSVDDIASWRSMQLSFSDVPLRQAVAEMERYGDMGIDSIDPQAAALRLSGTFDARNPAATRRLLSDALPVRLVQAAGGVEIRLAR